MDLMAWIGAFTKLHEKARRNGLDGDELKTYNTGKDELARALVASQQQTLKPGQTPRQALRVARAVQIDLDLSWGRVRALTLEISRGGFSALLEKAPLANELVGFTLKVPGGSDPILGRCKLLEIVKRQGNYRVLFTFESLNEEQLEKLDMILFDAVVEQFRRT